MIKSLAIPLILLIMLAACLPNNSSPSLSAEKLTVSIQEKNSASENYLVSILTNGIQNVHVASFPQVMFIIVKNGRFEIDVTIGTVYTLEVYRTDKESIEEMYKESKDQPAGAGEPEGPLIIYSLTAKEKMKSLELNIPSID